MWQKQKSQFADEKKLRENITDVYSSVCTQEARPSNLQVQRSIDLQQQVAKAETSRIKVVKELDTKVEAALNKEGLSLKQMRSHRKFFEYKIILPLNQQFQDHRNIK